MKCVLCTKDHPANYKGCEVYQEVIKRKFPPLRSKQSPSTESVKIFPTKPVHPSVSYAQIARHDKNLTEQNRGGIIPQSNEFAELKSMIKGLMNLKIANNKTQENIERDNTQENKEEIIPGQMI